MICSIISPCIILVISHEFPVRYIDLGLLIKPAAVFGAVTAAHGYAVLPVSRHGGDTLRRLVEDAAETALRGFSNCPSWG